MFFNRKKKKAEIDMTRLPVHIGVIMDGNGRWAKKRGLPRSAGHQAGADTLKKIVTECNKMGIKYITVYAFSTENWKRPQAEVDFLMNLLMSYLLDAERTLAGENVRIRAIGSRTELSSEMQEQIKKTEAFTSKNDGIVMNIALNYGSREELVRATQNLAEKVKNGEISVEDISADAISSELYTGGQPDPDLIIRTSNEQRLSNFMMWQASYSELYYTETLWPDFSISDLYDAILEYQKRDRRYGGVK
ncbi:MAG: isoprenyl transferase [Clostridia bacterium]|nr:isoprenyl transferase [Clostridia bacterium]